MHTIEDPASMTNCSGEVPDLKPYLCRDEKVIKVVHVKTPNFESLPDYRTELARLCNVTEPKDIGQNGPPMAAIARVDVEGQNLFRTLVVRDMLQASEDLLEEFPQVARATLLTYVKNMGMIECQHREEEFGRGAHELRDLKSDKIAQELTKKVGWEWPYYGSVDSTPSFVNLLHAYVTKTKEGANFLRERYLGRDGQEHTIVDALAYSLIWIFRRIHRNPESFIGCKPAFKGSIENQVLEDSWDSHFHSNGSLPNWSQDVYSTEVQGFVYDALLNAAEILPKHPKYGYWAGFCRATAPRLRDNIFRCLWIEDEVANYFASGGDRDERGQFRAFKVKKAIPLTLLDTKLFDWPEQTPEDFPISAILEETVRGIFNPNLLCAGGLRSLATNESRYMPGAYHNGSSWPVVTFKVAKGLRRQNYPFLAEELERRIVRVVEETKLFPENVRGDSEDEIKLNERVVDTYSSLNRRLNRREQPPQQIQLWTLSAYASIKYREQHRRPQLESERAKPNRLEREILSSLP